MRMSAMIGGLIAAMSGSMAFSGVPIPALQLIPETKPRASRGKPPRRVRTGRKYPHSSSRQQARYARQLAAGQLKIKRVGV